MILLEDLQAICPHSKSSRLETFVEPLNEAMTEFEINTPEREAAFLAQIAHESGGFVYVREIASGEAYDERADLGNTKPEARRIALEHGSTPGRWWRGHGLVQITGFDNHDACGRALGLDLLHKPHLLEEPVYAARSAAWFWKEHGCNEVADNRDMKRLTKIINGGLTGYSDRLAYYERAIETLT